MTPCFGPTGHHHVYRWWPVGPRHVVIYNKEKTMSEYYSTLHTYGKKLKAKSDLHSAIGWFNLIFLPYSGLIFSRHSSVRKSTTSFYSSKIAWRSLHISHAVSETCVCRKCYMHPSRSLIFTHNIFSPQCKYFHFYFSSLRYVSASNGHHQVFCLCQNCVKCSLIHTLANLMFLV
jgi:hypothetical protein